jgi:DNA-binding NtrC family response regulator
VSSGSLLTLRQKVNGCMNTEHRDDAFSSTFSPHLHLLVVEPNAALRDLLCWVCQLWNISSTEVATLQEVRRFLEPLALPEVCPLLLLDSSLNESMVKVFLRQIRQHRSFPCIVMTTSPSNTCWSEMEVPILQKPFHLQTLHEMISDVLLEAETQRGEDRSSCISFHARE